MVLLRRRNPQPFAKDPFVVVPEVARGMPDLTAVPHEARNDVLHPNAAEVVIGRVIASRAILRIGKYLIDGVDRGERARLLEGAKGIN